MELSSRAKATYLAHLWKCMSKQDHTEYKDEFSKIIGKDGVVFDVGAHGGQFCKLFSSITPQGHVYSYEPASYAYSILRRVKAFKRLKNVTLVQKALGEKPCTLSLNIPIKKSGSVGYGLSHFGTADDHRTYQQENVEQTTIDAEVKRLGLQRLDFIKADIEGWEYSMLLGAKETIKQFKPACFLEVSETSLQRSDVSVQNVWNFMTEVGYQGFVFNKETLTFSPAPCLTTGDILFKNISHN